MSRMLGKAGTHRPLVGSGQTARKCTCDECDITPEPRVQRKREERDWRAEIDYTYVGLGDDL